jgi:hypothetical protein
MPTATQEDAQQYDLGLKYGADIARIVIDKFPGGLADTICPGLIEFTKQELATVIDLFGCAGIAKRYREAFAAGYYNGLSSVFSQYRDVIVSKIEGLKNGG